MSTNIFPLLQNEFLFLAGCAVANLLLLEHVVEGGGESLVHAAAGVAVLHRQHGGRVPLRCLMIQMLQLQAGASTATHRD